MKHRMLSLVLVLCMLAAFALPVSAAEDRGESAAQSLYELGLFKGVGSNADGTPNFDLDRAPSRAEAVTMLVRLLGKEAEAESGTWETPFTDVPNWAKPYVGYAYENGLTKGVGGNRFGSKDTATAAMYLTFVLRVLGYQEEQDNYSWASAWTKTDEIGLTGGEYSAENNQITRGGLAIVSNDALNVNYNGKDSTLLDELVKSGAVKKPEPVSGIEQGENGLIISVTNQEELAAALTRTEPVEAIRIVSSFTVTRDCGVSYEGDKLENYANVTVTVEKDATLTVDEGGQIGIYWFTYEGDWENGTLPNGRLVNDGTIVLEKDGWINGEFTENKGTVLVKDGGQCQTMPSTNFGTVTVESGGSYRTTMGQEAVNEGTVTIAEGANMVARFGSTIVNNGYLEVNGLLSVGYVCLPTDDGEEHEELWFRNSGTLTGTGTAWVYDGTEDEGESTHKARMLELMKEAVGDAGLTVVAGVGTGV